MRKEASNKIIRKKIKQKKNSKREGKDGRKEIIERMEIGTKVINEKEKIVRKKKVMKGWRLKWNRRKNDNGRNEK